MTMLYCGIKRVMPDEVNVVCNVSPFSENTEDGALLGDRILEALYDGANLGVEVSPIYDADVVDDALTHEVDMLCSPNHDFFDIAETGHLVEPTSTPPVNNQD